MTVDISEKYRGTSGNADSWRIQYVIEATGADADKTEFELGDAAATVAEGESISSDDGEVTLVLGDLSVDEYHPGTDVTIAIATASYNLPELGSKLGRSKTAAFSELIYEFSYQVRGTHIDFAITDSTRGYDMNGPLDVSWLKDRIRVRRDGADRITEGVETSAGENTDTWRLTVPRGYMTSGYKNLIKSLMGGVNATTLDGNPPGTMRFVSAHSVVSSASIQLSLGFDYKPNFSGKVAGIPNVPIGGHEIWWPWEHVETHVERQLMIASTDFVIVQQIYPIVELNDLAIE